MIMLNDQAHASPRGLFGVCRGYVILLMIIGSGAVFAQDKGMPELDYMIGPDDVLDISVWKEETLQRKVVVRPDGKISFPLIGEIRAASHSAEEIQNEIAQRLKKYIPDPVVTVVIDKVSAYKIYVIGEVKNSGQYQVGHYLDVVQALALAGGLTPYAAENKIKILRRENNLVTVIPFEYAKVEAGIELKQNIILKRGDVVIVP
ncbi:MAG: polysaccharide biosynthesis/export family protein [Gammaproteobacteria bacterium]|jgi:polysaccharide export outer membrane protein|nr:polysaccharide biosynthesis/export family protein [Gammaproteobacteria bacterium]